MIPDIRITISQTDKGKRISKIKNKYSCFEIQTETSRTWLTNISWTIARCTWSRAETWIWSTSPRQPPLSHLWTLSLSMIRFATNTFFPKTEFWSLIHVPNIRIEFSGRDNFEWRRRSQWVQRYSVQNSLLQYSTGNLQVIFEKSGHYYFSCFSKRLYSIQCGMRHGRIVSNEMLVSVIPSLFIRVICSLTSSFNFFFTYLWAGSSSTRKCVLQVEERDSEIAFVLCVA